MEYMGPGTHIIDKVTKKVQPVNRVDAAALVHDIEYLHPGIPEKQADENALKNAGSYWNPLKVLMKAGFTLKDIGGGYDSSTDYFQYKYARERVEKGMGSTLNKYGIKFLPDPYDSSTTAGSY